MGIFGNKKQDLPPLLNDEDCSSPADYNSTIDYLVGLSDEEYTQVIKCAEISRKACKDQAKVLGMENEPTTFINPPLQTVPPIVMSGNFLEDDTQLGNFLTDEPPKKLKINKSEKPKGKK